MLYDSLLPANTMFRPKFKHGVPPVDVLGITVAKRIQS